MKRKQKLFAVALCCVSGVASAETECASLKITKVFPDGSNVFISTGAYLNGKIERNATFQQSVAAALAARATGQNAVIRYLGDNLSCEPGAVRWDEPIISIGM